MIYSTLIVLSRSLKLGILSIEVAVKKRHPFGPFSDNSFHKFGKALKYCLSDLSRHKFPASCDCGVE